MEKEAGTVQPSTKSSQTTKKAELRTREGKASMIFARPPNRVSRKIMFSLTTKMTVATQPVATIASKQPAIRDLIPLA
jgi:hypothetical protein